METLVKMARVPAVQRELDGTILGEWANRTPDGVLLHSLSIKAVLNGVTVLMDHRMPGPVLSDAEIAEAAGVTESEVTDAMRDTARSAVVNGAPITLSGVFGMYHSRDRKSGELLFMEHKETHELFPIMRTVGPDVDASDDSEEPPIVEIDVLVHPKPAPARMTTRIRKDPKIAASLAARFKRG